MRLFHLLSVFFRSLFRWQGIQVESELLLSVHDTFSRQHRSVSARCDEISGESGSCEVSGHGVQSLHVEVALVQVSADDNHSLSRGSVAPDDKSAGHFADVLFAPPVLGQLCGCCLLFVREGHECYFLSVLPGLCVFVPANFGRFAVLFRGPCRAAFAVVPVDVEQRDCPERSFRISEQRWHPFCAGIVGLHVRQVRAAGHESGYQKQEYPLCRVNVFSHIRILGWFCSARFSA